jgi:tight adherence protein B
VVAAVLLWTAPAKTRDGRDRLISDVQEDRPGDRTGGRRRWPWLAGLGAAVSGLAVAQVVGGSATAAVLAAALIACATAVRLALAALGLRRAARARVEVAHACTVLASQIRVGRVPAEALSSAAVDCPVLAEASRAHELGGDPATVWGVGAARPGHRGLGDLARAWQVSQQTGAPLAHSLEQVSVALAADVALRAMIAGELSATRATGKIMAVLPFCGLGMGYLLGGDPVHFLLSSPYGWCCLVGGVTLACAGVLWIDSLSQLAEEQG